MASNQALTVLGSRIRKQRELLGLSQEQFADRCGFDRTYISMIERGKRNISLLNLLRVAHGLNIRLSSLVEGLNNGPSPN